MRIYVMICLLVFQGRSKGLFVQHAFSQNKTAAISTVASTYDCVVYPSVPAKLSEPNRLAKAFVMGSNIVLANSYLAIKISSSTGIINSIENKVTGEHYTLQKDQTGVVFEIAKQKVEWLVNNTTTAKFKVEINNAGKESRVVLRSNLRAGVSGIVTYTLKTTDFWVERRISVINTERVRFQNLYYGRAEIARTVARELKLGKFDTPRLIPVGRGGVFAGVGWWFYEVKSGLYQNSAMNYDSQGTFESEPWYVGVFNNEAGEQYQGWLWYKTFLSERKLAYDKLKSYALWNARSGRAFMPINDPNLLDFTRMAQKIGLQGISAGEVSGMESGTKLATNNSTARKVIDAFDKAEVDFGLHEGTMKSENWETDSALARKKTLVDDAARQNLRQTTIDFLKVKDRFADHRRVTEYFRHLRQMMNYTECHLGMSVYGPQFQREVLLNHPSDLNGFDISHFSADWATLLGFRKSRSSWQSRYDYLMPENGLYYFTTHYSAFPRRYQDPEPQQFLYIADAWRGLAYAFHDKIGFRDALAAQAAFSTFYVFGFLDPNPPLADVQFARRYLAWVKSNTKILSRSRVVLETKDALVMSKIQNGRGAVFVLNYTPGRKKFNLEFDLESKKSVELRQIYPVRGKNKKVRQGLPIGLEVAGERLAIFEVNGGLNGLPPENPSKFPVDVAPWEKSGNALKSTVYVPNVRSSPPKQNDESLPERIVSADQTETAALLTKSGGKGWGALPQEFLDAYGFEDKKYLPTWKAAPWAFGNRIWFVFVPSNPFKITDKKPILYLNGRQIVLSPRVRYDPSKKGKNAKDWDVPMWFADVTSFCEYGTLNNIILQGADRESGGAAFITSSGEIDK